MAVILKKGMQNKTKGNKNKNRKAKTGWWEPTSCFFFFPRVHKLLFYSYCGMNGNIKPKNMKIYNLYYTMCYEQNRNL